MQKHKNDNFELFQLFDFVTQKFREFGLIKLDDGITLFQKSKIERSDRTPPEYGLTPPKPLGTAVR